MACNPRAITVFAVPRFPEIAIPPISRSIAPSRRAVLIASCERSYFSAGLEVNCSLKQVLQIHIVRTLV